MNKRIDRTRGRGRQDEYQDILERNERLQNGGRVGRTERLLKTETLTDEEEKKTLKPKWYTSHSQNRQPPQWCSSSPFITRGKTVYKKVLQNIPFQSMGIFPLILGEGEIDGP